MSQKYAIDDMFFTSQDVSEAVDLVARTYPDGCGGAFIAGSLSVGLGHAESDLDIVVVHDTAQTARQHVANGRRLDLTTVPLASWKARAESMARYAITRTDRSQGELDREEMTRTVRYAMADRLPLGDHLPGPDRDVVAQVMIYRNAFQVAGLAEDAQGALAVGDPYTALLAARGAVEAGLDALLSAERDLYIGPKFLLRRVARSPLLGPHLPAVWKLLHEPVPLDGLAGHAEGVVRRRLSLAVALVGLATTQGWDGTEGIAEVRMPSPSGMGPVQSPYHSLLRFTDGFVLAGPNVAYDLTDPMAYLWSLCTGAGAAAVHGEFTRVVDGDVTRDEIADAVAALAGLGVVETPEGRS
ncbi:hypothetical protein [Streptomyces coeruleorubidus]|uniref:hypothetical protein n=1 Tax=Streptomyces coeruleorubidus TaxID=116188 RepID=UPI0033AE0767